MAGHRSDAPGLQRVKRSGWVALYWRAARLTKEKGFPRPVRRIPRDASEEEISALCHQWTAELDAWRAHREPVYRYDGTIAGLCDLFIRHPFSPIREVKANTARTYTESMKVIRSTVGARALHAVTAIDVKRWYVNWRAPAEEGRPERTTRAHTAVSTLRMMLRFGQALELPECRRIAEALETLRFERASPRTGEMTVAQVEAFVATAINHARLPGMCGLYMAIGVAAQFETMLRQKDIIGEWSVQAPRGEWSGSFTWEAIAAGFLRIRTSKTGKMIEHDLTAYAILWPLIQRAPQSERRGAVVKGENGGPIRERTYRKWFREIAGAAGLPPTVWNMDARAGAITEAHEAGVEPSDIALGATHSTTAMTRRYVRRVASAVSGIATARAKHRAGSE